MKRTPAERMAALGAVATNQGGCFTRRQALAAGFTRHVIQRMLDNGHWVALQTGVYTWRGAPTGALTHAWAAVLACQDLTMAAAPGDGDETEGPRRLAAVSHRAAASMIGTRAFDASRLTEVSLAGDGRPTLERVTLHRMGDLSAEWITDRYGVPVTVPTRTVIDLAGVVTRRTVQNVLEEWLSDRKLTIEDVGSAVEALRGRGRVGPPSIERLISDRALGTDVADSETENLLAELLKRNGVPLPIHHFLLDSDGKVFAELDYAYPESWVALEVNGYGVHLRSQGRWEDDLVRHNGIETMGWSVLYYSRRRLKRQPRAVAKEINDHRLARLTAVTVGR